MTKPAPTAGAPGLGPYMAATRWQESGSPAGNYTEPNGDGAYQIIPSTWAGMAANAGFPGRYPNASSAPAAVQDAVAKAAMLAYYYGPAARNWYKVARAWNGGPDCINSPCRNLVLDPSGGDGVGVYANQVMAKYAQLSGNPAYTVPPGTTPGPATAGATAATAAGNAPATPGVHECYLRSPSFGLGLGLSLPSICFDWLIFGPMVLAGAGALIVGAALLVVGAGFSSSSARKVVSTASTVVPVGRAVNVAQRAVAARRGGGQGESAG